MLTPYSHRSPGIEGERRADRRELARGPRRQPRRLDVAPDVGVPHVVAEARGVGQQVAQRDRPLGRAQHGRARRRRSPRAPGARRAPDRCSGTGSSSLSLPCSTSCIAATEVMALVIEAMRNDACRASSAGPGRARARRTRPRRARPCRWRPSPRRPGPPWRRRPGAARRRSAPAPRRTPLGAARPAVGSPIDAAAAMAAAPFSTSRRLCGVGVMCGPSCGPGRQFIRPLSAIHFWIIWATWSEFLSIMSAVLHVHLLDLEVPVGVDLDGRRARGEHHVLGRQARQRDGASADVEAADVGDGQGVRGGGTR